MRWVILKYVIGLGSDNKNKELVLSSIHLFKMACGPLILIFINFLSLQMSPLLFSLLLLKISFILFLYNIRNTKQLVGDIAMETIMYVFVYMYMSVCLYGGVCTCTMFLFSTE